MNLLLWIIIIVLGCFCIYQGFRISEYQEKEKKLVATLSMIDRWFCNDYPPIQEITEFIKARMFDDANESVSELRARARRKK